MGILRDLTNERFGGVTVRCLAPRDPRLKSKMSRWVCVCDCGKTFTAYGTNLTRGRYQSCGCAKLRLIGDANRHHGMVGTKVYRAWASMINRCHNEKVSGYTNYGGRGIRVCDRWRESFENFYADMGDPPSESHSVERVDNNAGYGPDNCVWATKKQQSRNQRSNIWLTFRGERRTLPEWCEVLSLPRVCVWLRLFRYGWNIERALSSPAD